MAGSAGSGVSDAVRRTQSAGPRGSILHAPTPAKWVADALADLPGLLLDHATCEKKAASTALALMFAYADDRPLALALSRLAREELRHFEQVLRAMSAFGVQYARQRPGRYAHRLRAQLRTSDPGRKLDLLLAGALIEARSAERFQLLAARVPAALAPLYGELAACEARHFELYLEFAHLAAPQEWQGRLVQLAAQEAQLATTEDDTLRFHSGPLPADGRALT